ncbi:MAG: V-type ATP synthase subunit I [bacterium]|nr:MAG: V-type ATP synthase subunit I [bacterium]
MAVSRIKKFQLLGYRSLKQQVIDTLINVGAVHISNAKDVLNDEVPDDLIQKMEVAANDLEEMIVQLDHIIKLTSKYYEKPKGFEGLLPRKLTLSRQELEQLIREIDLQSIYEEAINLENQKKSINIAITKKQQLINDLTPWTELNVPIEQLTETNHVYLRLVIIKRDAKDSIETAISELTREFDIRVIASTKSLAYILIIFLRSHLPKISEIIKEYDGQVVEFEEIQGVPCHAIQRAETEITELDDKLQALEAKSKEFTDTYRNKMLALHDYYFEQLEKQRIQNNFAQTQGTFFIQGWIREKDEKKIRQKLEKISPELELITLAPEPDEKPPIAFDNKPYVSPFEFITTLYSRPDYREYDPTPLMAPFFILFFAVCLSDGGYGIVLAALSGWALKKFKPVGGGAKLLKVMFYGGIITIFVGAFTGGWFGLEISGLPQFLQNIVLINPLENPMGMLKFAFVLGIIQILVGISIKGIKNIQDGKVIDAILDQGLWIITLIFLVPLGYGFILGGTVSAEISNIASKGAQICLLALVLTQGHHQKGIVKKLLTGITKLYNIVGYFGDVLSYARLLALGLATSAIAMAINGVAKMTLGMPYGIGYIIFALIFIAGHLFNLAVNALGGFVHSSRLQFLEYFSKFFAGGGSEFRPFKKESRYSIVIEEG